MKKKCKVCKKDIRTESGYRNYCSHRCYLVDYRKRPEYLQCKNCGKEFIPKSYKYKYCSPKCRIQYNAAKVRDKSFFDCMREKVLIRDGYKCVKCGSTERLHVHHKDGSGQSNNPNNDMDNLETLCMSCHLMEHINTGFDAECLICGKTFRTSKYKRSLGKGKYCSRECVIEAQRGVPHPKPITKQITVQCKQCGKDMITTQARLDADRGRYCGKECQYEAMKTMPSMKKKVRKSLVMCTCQTCGKKFEKVISEIKSGRGKYCSRQCYYKAKKTS